MSLRFLPKIILSGSKMWTSDQCFTEVFDSNPNYRAFCAICGALALVTIDLWRSYVATSFGFCLGYAIIQHVPERVFDINVKSWANAAFALFGIRTLGLSPSFFLNGLCIGWITCDIQRQNWSNIWIFKDVESVVES